jgi:hypothetical protein
MRTRKVLLGAFCVLTLAAVAACGGANPATSYPSASVGGGSADSNISIALSSTSGLAVGSLSVGGSGSVSAQQSTTNPSAVSALALKHRATVATGQTPVAYVTVTAKTAVTISSVTVSVAPQPALTSGTFSLAYWNGSQWVSFANSQGLITTSPAAGGVITLSSGGISPAVTLAAGSSVYLCVYSGGGAFTTPTPPPPAPVVSPSAITLNLGIPQSVTVTSGIGITISAQSSNTGVVTVPSSETTGTGATATATTATFPLTPVAVGTATITFTDPLNRTTQLAVTVINTNPSPVPSPEGGIIGANDTVTFQIPAKSTITATSSNTAVLTVTPSASPIGGYATIMGTAVSPGTVTVTFEDTVGDTGTFNGQVSAIQNGGFTEGSGGLQGWTPCSYGHAPYSAPITETQYDNGTAQTATTSAVSSSLTALVSTVDASTVPDSNPTASPLPSFPPFGTSVVRVGSTNGSATPFPQGAFGICQTITVPAASTPQYLTFYGWLAGSGYSFKYEDQEADIVSNGGTTLNSTGATTLFAEQACYLNPTGSTPTGSESLAGPIIGPGASTASSCWGGYSGSYLDWIYGGYWQPFGPYKLSPYAGQTVTLFIGDWNDNTGSYADNTYDAQLLFVGNVETSTTTALPGAAPLTRRRMITISMPQSRGAPVIQRVTRPAVIH